MHDILAHATRFDAWNGSVEFAADLAARLDGTLTGAHVQPSPLYMMPAYGSPALLAAIIEEARSAEAAAQTSGDSFVAWANRIGVRQAAWQVSEGQIPQALAHLCNWHDLLVLERDADSPWGSASSLASVVRAARIPCIVTPRDVAREASLSCIALAWNGSPEALRAIHAARALLGHASRVVLLEGARREDEIEMGWRPQFDIGVYLARHAVRFERQVITAADADAGDALLEACAQIGADLLVMGAYGRTRFSEWMLGGATRTVLATATLPVLLRT